MTSPAYRLVMALMILSSRAPYRTDGASTKEADCPKGCWCSPASTDTCLNCRSGYLLQLDATCVPRCQPGWVFINQRESCEPCPDRCARCKDGNTCLECHPPALLAARGKCLVVNDNIFSDGANKPQLAVGAPESPALNLLVQSDASIEFWPYTSQVETLIERDRIGAGSSDWTVTLTVMPSHGKLWLVQPQQNYYQRKILRQGDVLDLATFQQSRFVYQHDLSSSWRHEQPGSQWQRPSTDLASLSLGSNSQRAPLLPLYHIIFVVVTRLPTASTPPPFRPQQDSPWTRPALRVVQGGAVVVSKDYVPASSPPTGSGSNKTTADSDSLVYVLANQPKFGTLWFAGVNLRSGDPLTYAELTGGKVKYEAMSSIPSLPVQDLITWNVTVIRSEFGDAKNSPDSANFPGRASTGALKRSNRKEWMATAGPSVTEQLTVVVEPRDKYSLTGVFVNGELAVDEGSVEILSPDIISINASDALIPNLKVVLDKQPAYGHLEIMDRTGTKKVATASSFPLTALLQEQLSYVQTDHRNMEPRTDAFRFYITDGINRSPTMELPVLIEDVNDEPPQVTTHPLVMSTAENSVRFTVDHVQIDDQDTEATDLSLKIIRLPSHGQLEKYDELTNSQEAMLEGGVFYYQDMLEGDITYVTYSKAEYQDELHLEVSDGDSSKEVLVRVVRKAEENMQEYATTAPLIETGNRSPVGEAAVDMNACVMQFRQTEMSLEEDTAASAQIAVLRTGDTSVICSVLCSTRSGSATPADYDDRPAVETSRIFFLRGVTSTACTVRVKDDVQREGDELFSVHLSRPQVEYSDVNATSAGKAKRAAVGAVAKMTIRIRDEEDVTRVRFNQSTYQAVAPTASSNSTILTVQLVRTGDLRSPTKVSIQSKDGSARANVDYAPLTSSASVEFKSNEAKATIQLLLFVRAGWTKSFTLFIDSNSLSNAQLANPHTATVIVPTLASIGPTVLPSEPIVVSLMHYGTLAEQGGHYNRSIPNGYPVVCVTPCDPKYPKYNVTHRLCQNMGIDVSKIRFSWEVAPPASGSLPQKLADFQLGGNTRKLSHSTLFSSVEERVLDSVFFGANFRVRCVAQPMVVSAFSEQSPSDAEVVFGVASRSRLVTISANGTPCPGFIPGESGGGGQQPFQAVLSYVNASDALHPDTMRIQVKLPHQDGMIPVLSTNPLHALRYLLAAEPVYRSHHQCSNLQPGLAFLDESMPREANRRKYPYEYSKSLRQESTLRLYRHLDFNTCLWSFDAWFKMTDLVEVCGGQVISNPKVLMRSETMVTVRVPLYVAIVTTGPALEWSHLEHQTEMEFSFSYTSVLWHQGVESKASLAPSLHITRIHSDPNGRLIVEFQTETKFAGRYLLRHPIDPLVRTQLVVPASVPAFGFETELTWSQTDTNANSVQKWRAVSNYTTQDYTGVYTLQLVPCLSVESARLLDAQQHQQQRLDCQPVDTINVNLPIHYQLPFRPLPVRYALETTFQLTNNVRAFLRQPRSVQDIKDADLVGPFRSGETVYGRVLWHPSHDLSSGYKLRIEKLYLCAGRDGYVPVFDPTGERPQYGCLENSSRLKYRLLLLDREDPYASDKIVQGIALQASFAAQVDQLRPITQIASMDGFVFSVDPLFQLETGLRWFLQVSYTVQSGGGSRWRREEQATALRHGTNLRPLSLLWPADSARPSASAAPLPAFASTLIAVVLLIVLVITALIFLFVYYCRPPARKRKTTTRTVTLKTMLGGDRSSASNAAAAAATLVAEESTLI